MFLKNRWNLMVVVLLLINGAMAEQCMVELKDASKGVHVTVESCGNIGTFSVGGLSDENRWEKLTYHYPEAWKGTFLSVKIDGRVYSNFVESQDKIFMDPYLESGPRVEGETIQTSWRLPGDIRLEERFELVDRGVMLTLEIVNEGTICVDTGIRLHLDTMLGENDGAPIYIPGDGLKSKESDYSGKSLDFRYWKAYNTADEPSIIATGILYGQSYPDRVVIANWKKSIYSSWDYAVDGGTSILGDSAVILYYETGKLDPGEKKTITTSYINGEPVISSGDLGIGEIVTAENVEAIYCPGSTAVIKVDVLSRKPGNEGQLKLEVRDEKGNVVYSEGEYTGIMGDESVDIPFRWQTPGNITPTYFNVYATLYDMDGKEVDRKETQILVDNAACRTHEGAGLNWILLLIPLFVILAGGVIFVVVNIYSKLGDVEIVKEKEGERVKVTVWNKKKKEIENCMIMDRITEGAEVDILTSGVKRKDTELIQYVGKLESGDKAILEYRIRDVEFLPPAVVRWDFGESVSS